MFESPKYSDITPKQVFLQRRQFMQTTAGFLAAAMLPKTVWSTPLSTSISSSFGLTDKPTAKSDVISYNNFYEFGTSKDDPANKAASLKTDGWTLRIEGEVKKPASFSINELMKIAPLEERIYRHRCVETWSMVVPWIGYSLAELLKKAEPTSKAKYVEFVSLMDPEQMPGQKSNVLEWPYREGLRIDEAMHPLTLLTLGFYGEVLPNQNGAPVRIVIPWKYGFKSVKSIVAIRLTEMQPITSWMKAGPNEYGFYANVNPLVDHPRWSQAKERRLGEFLKRPTLPFNGYADQVASLYTGMDLSRYF